VAKERDAADVGCRRVKSGERRPGERAMRAEEGRVGDSPHKHLECDTLVSGTHIKALGVRREKGVNLTPANFGSSRDGGDDGKAFVCRFV